MRRVFYALFGILAAAQLPGVAAVFTVTNATDGGTGSLRAAIQLANTTPGPNRIEFNIPGAGVHTIFPFSELPALTNSVTIDGYLQPGSHPNGLTNGIDALLLIELNGTNAGFATGLRVSANNCTIRGLTINRFEFNGIQILSVGNTVEGNFIGTDTTGRFGAGNGEGIRVSSGAAGNTIGGNLPLARNLISGNGDQGVWLFGDDNRVHGNFIGTDLTGNARVPNGVGVQISGGDTNVIGGSLPGESNLISGNDGDGISISNPENTPFGNVIQGNRIGTDVTGTVALSNDANGISLLGAEACLVGGANSGAGNIISGNGQAGVGFENSSSGNTLQGNLIGTDAGGKIALPNGVGTGLSIYSGVVIISSPNNLIGGTASGAGNVISGNANDGLLIFRGSSGTLVQGNLIGTDATGTQALGNGSSGVRIDSSSFNTVGGGVPGARNVISANGLEGVLITNPGSGNIVSGNLIGTASDATSPLGNGTYGVFLATSVSNNLIGGFDFPDTANTIAFNGAAGVFIGQLAPLPPAQSGNGVLGNSIFSNGGLAIDLGPSGVTSNDFGDQDTGPNNLQNFPELTSAAMGTDTIVQGTLNSVANSTFRIEFFANNNEDPSGFGECERFIGFTNVTTGDSGNAFFTFVADTAVPVGQWITATATALTNNTSESSQALQVRAGNWTVRYNGPGNSHDQAASLAVDGPGFVYTAGVSYNSSNSDYATIKYGVFGQVQWVARYDGGGFDGATALAVGGAGNVYVTGFSAAANGAPDFGTIRYAPNGVQQWVAHYNGPGNGYDAAKAIQVDAAGNVYVTGDSRGIAGFDFATVKYDAAGNQLWVARYDGADHGDDSPAGLAVDAAGNVYVSGWSSVTGGGTDCATVKYSPAGEQLWAALYHGPASRSDNAATALALDRAGNAYITGYSYASASGYDYVTLKYAPDGGEVWARRYDGPSHYDDQAAALALDASTNVLVTGYSYGIASSADYATVKYNLNGDQLWVARYDGPASLYDAATALGVDPAGNVFITGVSSVSTSSSDYVTIKYEPGGTDIWINRYNGPGSPSEDSPAAIAVDNNGVAYVTGFSRGSASIQDYLTAKYVEADTPAPPIPAPLANPPALYIQNAGPYIILHWTNPAFVLQSAPAPAGPFSTISGAASPHTNMPANAALFFRLQAN